MNRRSSRGSNRGRYFFSIGLVIVIIGILIATFSLLEYRHFENSMFMSEDTPGEIRSFLEIPQSFLALSSISGILVASLGVIKYLTDIHTQ